MTLQQHKPPHVGGVIYRTYIELFDNISANKIADSLGVARSTFNRLINEKSNLSPEMTLRLSAVLGGSAESWLRMQESYDLWQAREKISVDSFTRMEFDAVGLG